MASEHPLCTVCLNEPCLNPRGAVTKHLVMPGAVFKGCRKCLQSHACLSCTKTIIRMSTEKHGDILENGVVVYTCPICRVVTCINTQFFGQENQRYTRAMSGRFFYMFMGSYIMSKLFEQKELVDALEALQWPESPPHGVNIRELVKRHVAETRHILLAPQISEISLPREGV